MSSPWTEFLFWQKKEWKLFFKTMMKKGRLPLKGNPVTRLHGLILIAGLFFHVSSYHSRNMRSVIFSNSFLHFLYHLISVHTTCCVTHTGIISITLIFFACLHFGRLRKKIRCKSLLYEKIKLHTIKFWCLKKGKTANAPWFWRPGHKGWDLQT